MSPLRAFWLAEVRNDWAVICRIGFGFSLAFAWLSCWSYADALFGPDGLGSLRSMTRAPEVAGLFPPNPPFDVGKYLFDAGGLRAALVALIVSAAMFGVGLWPAITGSIALALHVLFVTRMPFAHWGWASMVMPLFLYTIFAQRQGPTGPAWPKRLVQIHICTMYAITGWARLGMPGWLKGSMVYDALTNLMFSRLPFDWNPWIPLLAIPNWVVYVLEPCAPVLLWLPTVGIWCAVALIAMHVGLEVVSLVDWWNYVMILGLLTFLPERWLSRRKIDSPDTAPVP